MRAGVRAFTPPPRAVNTFTGQWAMHRGSTSCLADLGRQSRPRPTGWCLRRLHPQTATLSTSITQRTVTRYRNLQAVAKAAMSCSVGARSRRSAPPSAPPGRTAFEVFASAAPRRPVAFRFEQPIAARPINRFFSDKITGFSGLDGNLPSARSCSPKSSTFCAGF